MISYQREIRLNDLEIYYLFKHHMSLGYLIIEDLRRALNKEELELYPYKYMPSEEIEEIHNVIKVDILSDEALSEEDEDVFRSFAYDLLDGKENGTLIIKYRVNSALFERLPINLGVEDYKEILNAIDSTYDITTLHLRNLKHLSQE